MPAANHSFSSFAYWNSRKFVGIALGLGAAVLAGCNGSNTNLGSSLSSAAGYEEKKINTIAVESSKLPAAKLVEPDTMKIGSVSKRTKKINALEASALKSSASKKSAYIGSKSPSVNALQVSKLSARCRYIFATAGADATLLRTPTVSGEIDHDGNLGASIAYDVVDMRRARLKEELADADCRRASAISKITSLLVTSPQSLTRAGYVAKANSLRNSRSKLNNVRRQIRNGVSEGLITTQTATVLRQTVDRVQAQEARIRGEASRRDVVDAVQIQSVEGLDRELVAAEEEVARISREVRQANTFNVNVSGGYNVPEEDNAFISSNRDDFYGNVKMSVRLGAFSSKRQAYEDEVTSARMDGLFEDQSGVFWRVRELQKANARALNSLLVQRREVAAALSESLNNSRLGSAAYEPELFVPKVRGQIDAVTLKAELAGLDATIADTRRISRKLSFKRNRP